MKYNYVPDDLWKELAIDFAKRWLSHDGLWFQAAEKKYGLEQAIELDMEAWKTQTKLEAKRIMTLLNMEEGGGLDALEQALSYRMYAFINEQRIERPDVTTLDFFMDTCRVQQARERKKMDVFPCKPVGIVEYQYFAETIDPDIKTECIACPPDQNMEKWHCGWRFTKK